MNTVKIFFRTDHLNKDGSHAVCIRLISRRRKKDISLRIYVKAKDWNFNRNLVYKTDPKSERKNKLIKHFIKKAENIVDDCYFSGKSLNFDEFEKQLLNKDYSDDSFLEFALDVINKKDYSKETRRQCTAQITKLRQFKKDVRFTEINKNFIQNYKSYMKNKLGNNENTLNKSLSRLKTFVNWAVEENLMKENPFEKIKISKIDGKREHLNIDELKKLEEIYYQNILNDRQSNVLRYFLFVCYTGLRYSDIKNLKFMNIRKRFINGQETKFIDINIQKTSQDVSIPLINKALKLIPKEINARQTVFRVLSNQKTNEYLKEIIKLVEIDKNITFHCARHTLATTGLDMGIPIEVISKILGHTEIKITQIYAKVNDGLKYREMLKLDTKCDEKVA